MKSLYARVNTAFESADPEDCKDYIQEMRANWYEIEKRLSRTVFLLILVALAGGIMIAGAVSQIELAGIQLKDLRIASTAAPILVSFLWLQTISLYTSTAIYEGVHLHLMHRTQPSITEEDLQSLLMPTTTVSAPPTLVLQDMGQPAEHASTGHLRTLAHRRHCRPPNRLPRSLLHDRPQSWGGLAHVHRRRALGPNCPVCRVSSQSVPSACVELDAWLRVTGVLPGASMRVRAAWRLASINVVNQCGNQCEDGTTNHLHLELNRRRDQ